MSQTVLLEVKDHVATITLNRPEVHNAFDEQTIAHLIGAFDDLSFVEDATAIVIKGNGKSSLRGRRSELEVKRLPDTPNSRTSTTRAPSWQPC